MLRGIAMRLALCAALLGWAGATVAAEPYRTLSPPGEAPHPAVLLVPGCSGFTAANGVNHYEDRAAELQAAGFFVVFATYLDRFGNCGHVSHAEAGERILEAARWTRDQPGIDTARISVIAWSYGGGGVIAALRSTNPGPPALAKAVLYYPDCRGETPWTASRVSALMLMGAADDVARPAACDAVVKGAPANTLRTILYPDALHAFDSRGLPERAEYPFGTIGYNAEAARASWATVLDFLR